MAAATPAMKPEHRRRIDYWRRAFRAYLTGSNSQLAFWDDFPRVNEGFQPAVLVQTLTNEQHSGQEDWSFQIRRLLTLEPWFQTFLD